ncbi:stress responsive A/B barrel domain-containing protein [Umbelopsis sp. PMI_123]|nr:stress responsive A/B barrel domain-containing protein [Umbelopsis sp. PMI_123]
MAVIHVVLVKFKPTVSEAVKKELCDKVCALKDTIPGITKATAGKNFSDRGKGFEWDFRNHLGWVFEHVSKKDLDSYAIHPAHVEFVKELAPYREDILAFDYEA